MSVLSPAQLSMVNGILNSCRSMIGCEACALFLIHNGSASLEASSSNRQGNRVEHRLFEAVTAPARGLTSHIADLFVNPTTKPPAYLDGDTIRLSAIDLRSSEFLAGEPSLHLHDVPSAILAVAIRSPRSRSVLGFLKLHNPTDPAGFSEPNVAVARTCAALLVECLGLEHVSSASPVEEFLAPDLSKALAASSPKETIEYYLDSLISAALRLTGAEAGAASLTVRLPRASHSGYSKDLEPTLIQRHLGHESVDAESILLHARRPTPAGEMQPPAPYKACCVTPLGSGHGALAVFFSQATSEDTLNRCGAILSSLTRSLPELLTHLHRVWADRAFLMAHSHEWFRLQSATGGQTAGRPEIDHSLETICDLMQWDRALLYLPDFRHRVLRVRAGHGLDSAALGFSYGFEESKSLAVRAWHSGEAQYSASPGSDGLLNERGRLQFNILHGCLAVPLASSSQPDGRPFGVAVFWSDEFSRRPRAEHIPKVSALCRMMGDAITGHALSRAERVLFDSLNVISLRVLGDQTEDAGPGRPLEAAMDSVVLAFMEAIRAAGFERVRHFVYDAQARCFEARRCFGMQYPERFNEKRIDIRHNGYARDTVERVAAVRHGMQEAIFYDPNHNPLGKDPNAGDLEKGELQQWVVVPLTAHGRLVGQLAADTGQPRPISWEGVRPFLNLLVNLARLHLEAVGREFLEIRPHALRRFQEKVRMHAQAAQTAADLLARARGTAQKPEERFQRALDLDAAGRILSVHVQCQDRLLDVFGQWLQVCEPASPVAARPGVSLRRTALAAIERLRPFAEAARVELPDPDEADAITSVPAELLRIAVENLVHNAVLVSQPGQRVRVRVVWNAAAPAIEVSDEGPGIPNDQHDLILEPFVSIPRRTPDTTHRDFPLASLEHAGLGLFLANQVAVRYGGLLRCSPSPGGPGTVFVFEVPEFSAGRRA